MGTHYIIGTVFGLLLLNILGLEWARHPTLFFVMQPVMGFGIAASKTLNPNVVRLRSIVAHAIFGIGLYGAALFLVLLARS